MPHVALIIETSMRCGREILLGIGRFLALHGPWSIHEHERGVPSSAHTLQLEASCIEGATARTLRRPGRNQREREAT